MIPALLERLETAHREFTWAQLCYRLIPCATVLRWRARTQAGQALLQKPGPKKKPLLDGATLRRQIQQLSHGPRRTHGTGELREYWSEVISRRDFQELVAEERQNKSHRMKRIVWLRPGVAWSTDSTGYDSEQITPVRDLASRYQLPSPLAQPTEDGERIAEHLDLLFKSEGAPVFLKKDLGSPLNCLAVDEVLERYRVLPLNSPPGYPRYNGAIERGMQDLKAALDQQRCRGLVKNMPLSLELELVTHKLNHRKLRSLGGLTPCQVYHDPERRLRLHRPARDRIFREIFEQFWQFAKCVPERTRHNLRAGWRWIVEDWLRRQGWITVRDNRQPNVSTNSNEFLSQK